MTVGVLAALLLLGGKVSTASADTTLHARFQFFHRNGAQTFDSGFVPLVHGYDATYDPAGSGKMLMNVTNNLDYVEFKVASPGGPFEFARTGRVMRVTFVELNLLGVGSPEGNGNAGFRVAGSNPDVSHDRKVVEVTINANHEFERKKLRIPLVVPFAQFRMLDTSEGNRVKFDSGFVPLITGYDAIYDPSGSGELKLNISDGLDRLDLRTANAGPFDFNVHGDLLEVTFDDPIDVVSVGPLDKSGAQRCMAFCFASASSPDAATVEVRMGASSEPARRVLRVALDLDTGS